MEQEVRQIVVGDKDVREAVVIIVGKSHTHATPDVARNASFGRDVLKGPIAAIPVECVGQSFEILRVGVNTQIAVALTAVAVKIGSPVSVIDHEQVQPAVVIVVEPAGGNRPLVTLDSRFLRHILELSIAQVAIKNVPVDACNKQILMAIVVEVRCGSTHGIAGACDSGLRRDVREFHTAIVAIEPVEKLRRILFQRGDRRAIREKDVHSSVVVIIQRGDTARHRFDHVLARRGIVLKHEVQASALGNLAKTDRGKRERGL